MKPTKRPTEAGTPKPDPKYRIDILPKGPYLVYGKPRLQQEILETNEENIPWKYVKGREYSTEKEPTALCRCGHSRNHPYCDGSHTAYLWDAELTADNQPLLENAEIYDGPTVELADNMDYCAHARICLAKEGAWKLTATSDDPEKRDLAIYESCCCPAGRLKIWDKRTGEFIEPPLQPALGLIEDPQEECSGPLWVMGGIPVNGSDGTLYEQRNRVTLCRCGVSGNKPYCDGSHTVVKFQDCLPIHSCPKEETT